MLDFLPNDLLFNFVCRYIRLSDFKTLRLQCRKLNDIVKYIIQNYKYNEKFLSRQLNIVREEYLLLNKKKTVLKRQSNLIETETKLVKIRLNRSQQILKELTVLSLGEPEGWIGCLEPLNNHHSLWIKIPIESFLSNFKKTIIFAPAKNTEEQLLAIDSKLQRLGWIKFFPNRAESERALIHFAYLSPTIVTNEHVTRTPWHDCPICASSTHTMYKCPKKKCFICHQPHLTRHCQRVFCKTCRRVGHLTKLCPRATRRHTQNKG